MRSRKSGSSDLCQALTVRQLREGITRVRVDAGAEDGYRQYGRAEDWQIRDQLIHAKLARLARSIGSVFIECGPLTLSRAGEVDTVAEGGGFLVQWVYCTAVRGAKSCSGPDADLSTLWTRDQEEK